MNLWAEEKDGEEGLKKGQREGQCNLSHCIRDWMKVENHSVRTLLAFYRSIFLSVFNLPLIFYKV